MPVPWNPTRVMAAWHEAPAESVAAVAFASP